MTSPLICTVGVHVLDAHVLGIESVPQGSEGQLVDTIRFSPAGTAGGTAVVLSRLGAQVRSFGAVGTDLVGDTLLAALHHEGVDVDGLVRKGDHQTSSSVIPVRPNGDRPAWHCIGANGAFTLDDVDRHRLDGLRHLHLGGPEFLGGEAAGRLLAEAHERGASTSVDVLAPGDPGMLEWIADVLPHTDYLLPNDEQVLGFTGASDLESGARALVAAGAGCVAVTAGADGALVVTADETIHVPALPVDVVDTTGCGDAFSAGFVLARVLHLDLATAGRWGCATAAQVAGALGSDGGVYDRETVRSLAS